MTKTKFESLDADQQPNASNWLDAVQQPNDTAIGLFNLIMQRDESLAGSRDPNNSPMEKDQHYKQSEKLRRDFNRLADKADGKLSTRNASRGEAFALSYVYLLNYPKGSLTLNKDDTPSIFKFAKGFTGKVIESDSGPLEIEAVKSTDGIRMALNGKCTEFFKFGSIRMGFYKAKKAIKEKTSIS